MGPAINLDFSYIISAVLAPFFETAGKGEPLFILFHLLPSFEKMNCVETIQCVILSSHLRLFKFEMATTSIWKTIFELGLPSQKF